MRIIIILLFILPQISFSQVPKILQKDYSFLVTDGEVIKLHQSNDTLYELKCYINKPCEPRPKDHYKIISSKSLEGFIILKLESLDTIYLTTDPYPDTRYQLLAIKVYDSSKLGYLTLSNGLTRKQLDTTTTNISLLKDKFFFTYFSDGYLKELSTLKKITTKDEVKEIMETAQKEDFKILAEKYKKTNINDMYAAGFTAEILNLACIAMGFNPIGAGREINKLMRQ
jgi:hypothetical protein